MEIKQSFYNLKSTEEIKAEIIRDRLKNLFAKNPKKIAKVFEYLIKRSKNG